MSFSFIGSDSIWGAAGVTGFFILSGFLSKYHYQKKGSIFNDCINNLLRFFIKFYPMYFIFLIVYAFITKGSISDFFRALFLTQSYWGKTDIAMAFHGNAWFLSSIMLSYFLSPILISLTKKNNRSIIITTIVLFLIQITLPLIWRNDFQNGYYWVYIFPFTRIIDFYYGILICTFIEENEIHLNKNMGIIIFIIYLVELLLINYIPIMLFRYDIAWVPVTILLIVYFYHYDFHNDKNTLEHIIKIGRLSFEIFLCHRLILKHISTINNGFCGWIISLLIIYSISCLFHEFNNRIRLLCQRWNFTLN